jgi:hypothetical protein
VVAPKIDRNAPEIEKGIPLPSITGRGRPVKYNFAIMEVGDSFNVLVGDRYPKEVMGSVCAAVSAFCRRYAPDRKYTVRTSDQGIRVWRIK